MCFRLQLCVLPPLWYQNQFYIVDSVISMLFTMIMDVILHKALLILLMVIHPILLPLINEFIPEISTIWDCCYLFVQLAQKPKYFNGFEEYVAEKLELFQDIPDLVEDFDSPICLACTMAKKLQYLLLLKAYFPPIWYFWRFLIITLNWHKMTKFLSFGLLWLVLLGTNNMA